MRSWPRQMDHASLRRRITGMTEHTHPVDRHDIDDRPLPGDQLILQCLEHDEAAVKVQRTICSPLIKACAMQAFGKRCTRRIDQCHQLTHPAQPVGHGRTALAVRHVRCKSKAAVSDCPHGTFGRSKVAIGDHHYITALAQPCHNGAAGIARTASYKARVSAP